MRSTEKQGMIALINWCIKHDVKYYKLDQLDTMSITDVSAYHLRCFINREWPRAIDHGVVDIDKMEFHMLNRLSGVRLRKQTKTRKHRELYER